MGDEEKGWWERNVEDPMAAASDRQRESIPEGFQRTKYDIETGIAKGVYHFGKGMVTGVIGLAKLAYKLGTDPETQAKAWETSKQLAQDYYAVQYGSPAEKEAVAERAARFGKGIMDQVADDFKKDWAKAKQEGKEAETLSRWGTQGVLEVASLFVGVGELKQVANAGKAANLAEKGAVLSKVASKCEAAADVGKAADKAADAAKMAEAAEKAAEAAKVGEAGSDMVKVYRVQPKTETDIITGGAFRREREAGKNLVEANAARKKRLELVNSADPKKRAAALHDAQASGKKSPFISTTLDKQAAEADLAERLARGESAELITMEGPRSAGTDFEEEFSKLGGRKKRLKDAEMKEYGIPDLYIPPDGPSKSGFRITDRKVYKAPPQ